MTLAEQADEHHQLFPGRALRFRGPIGPQGFKQLFHLVVRCDQRPGRPRRIRGTHAQNRGQGPNPRPAFLTPGEPTGSPEGEACEEPPETQTVDDARIVPPPKSCDDTVQGLIGHILLVGADRRPAIPADSRSHESLEPGFMGPNDSPGRRLDARSQLNQIPRDRTRLAVLHGWPFELASASHASGRSIGLRNDSTSRVATSVSF